MTCSPSLSINLSRPYKAKVNPSKESKEWAYYLRKNSSTVRAKGDDERELLSLAATVPFDDRYNQSATLNDLSPRLIEAFLREVGSELADQAAHMPIEDLARQLSIVGGPVERPFPKNVGLLFFNEAPHQFFPVTQIDVVWFTEEGPGGDQFSEKIFHGPLPQMIRDALDFIQRNFITETVTKHPDRAEATRVRNFPYEAIEEAVVNAIYHRGYDVREPVEIRISQQEIIILSYPGPDRSVRLEHLREGRAKPRRYRNRRIGEFLKELEFTEGRATGIPKIMRVMQQNGSSLAEFDFDEEHSYFMVRLPVHSAALAVRSSLMTQSPTQSPTQLDESIGSLLMALKSGPQSSSALRQALGIKHRPTFRENYLHIALKRQLIEYTLPDKPNSRLQQYQLTDKGQQWINQRFAIL